MEKLRHLVRIPVYTVLLHEMLTEGFEMPNIRVTKGLPEGAEYVGEHYDRYRHTWYLVFHHSSFDPLLPGEDIPILDVEIQALP